MKSHSKQNRYTSLLRFFIITIVTILFLGNSSPVSATTPVTFCNGSTATDCEKPEGLTLLLPFANGRSVNRGGYNYGAGDHTNQDFYALDFMIEPGADVRAVASGTVVWSGWYDKDNPVGSSWRCYGNSIAIKHDVAGFPDYISFYTHLSAISSNASVRGIQVNQGDVIGQTGDTGLGLSNKDGVCRGSGSHLHFVLTKGDSNYLTGTGTHPPKGGVSVVPEPFIGQEVYEGFGAPVYYKGTTDHPITAANIGTNAWSGNPTWDSSNGAVSDLSNISKGSPVVFAVKDIPLNTKEVRFTAWYDGPTKTGWSDGNDDAKDQNWRILARCWPSKNGDALPPSSCQWGLNNNARTLKFEWFPYDDRREPVAPWQMSGSSVDIAYNNSPGSSNNEVCISFDIFDDSGNVAYAGGGTRCGTPSATSFNLKAASSVNTDSARAIYLSPVYSQSTDNILPTGSWSSPSSGQTISSSTVTLSVNATDNPGGSGVREVRWAAKYGGQWYGIGTAYGSPYSTIWDWCKAGVQNGDVELGFEVWDNANNKWVYSEHAPAGNIHINKNYNCDNGGGGSINWSTHFYNGMDHWWNETYTGGEMCSGSFSQGNLDQNYGNGSPCNGGATDNWVGDYKATVNFLPGNYAFWVDHDDWLKLKVDGREIYSVNGVHSEWKCVDNGYLYLSGNHDIWAILAEQGGDARIKVEWSKNNGVCDLPAAFNKSSPLNGLGGQSINPTLSWGVAGGAKSYSYCVVTAADNALCDSNGRSVGSATSVDLTGLNPGTTYYWKVKAYSQGGAGTEADNGTWWSFTTQSNPPDAFGKITPTNNDNAQSTNPTLSWAASNGASWYQYCYDTTNDNICDNDMWYSAGTDTSAYVASLAGSATYYWQVRSSNSGGVTYADGGAWWSFTTQSNYALTVSKTGNGTGTVTSDSAEINCGVICSANFDSNVSVTLTAVPAIDSTFTGWSGACTGTGACIVTMDATKSVIANFILNTTYVLTVSKTGIGTGTVTSSPLGINCGATCAFNFSNNTAVTLSATPSAGSTFTGWSGACTGTGTCVVTMNTAKSVTASFSIVSAQERLKNGGFNTYPTTTSKIPTYWTPYLAATDGKDIATKQEGIASVKIAGLRGITKTLSQTFLLSGASGSKFTFSFWVKGTLIPATAICRAQVFFYNGTTALTTQTKTIICPTGTYAFQKKTLTFNTTMAYTKILVRFTYNAPSGAVWIDGASLLK